MSQQCPNDPLLSVSWQSSLKRFDSKERFVNVANFFKAEKMFGTGRSFEVVLCTQSLYFTAAFCVSVL